MRRHHTKLTVLLLLFLAAKTHAQLRFPITNTDLRTSLQKVLSDYPREFSTLRGEVMVENPQSVEYTSQLEFKGAEENTITRFNGFKPMYSWQAVVLTSEDFEEAKKKYKWLFNQLKVMSVKLDNGYSYTLDGKFEEADESRKFSSSTFVLVPSATNLPKVKVEVNLQFYFPEWKVGLVVYEKEREDKDRGKEKEDDSY